LHRGCIDIGCDQRVLLRIADQQACQRTALHALSPVARCLNPAVFVHILFGLECAVLVQVRIVRCLWAVLFIPCPVDLFGDLSLIGGADPIEVMPENDAAVEQTTFGKREPSYTQKVPVTPAAAGCDLLPVT